MEVPLCTLSPFRRHPPSVKTWDLLRSSTYEQHPKPNCYASCGVLTNAAHCDCVCLCERSSILGTVLGGCSWSAFRTVSGGFSVYLPRATPGPFHGHSGTQRRLTDHSFARSFARSRHEGEFGRQCSAKHSKAMPWVFSLRSAAEGGSKTHTQGVHAWPSTDLQRPMTTLGLRIRLQATSMVWFEGEGAPAERDARAPPSLKPLTGEPKILTTL